MIYDAVSHQLRPSFHAPGGAARSRAPDALTVREYLEPDDDEGGVAAALATLRALVETSGDAEARGALDDVIRRVDPAYVGKARRLSRAAELVNSSLDVDVVLGMALEVAVEVMNAERGFIVLRDGRQVVARAADGRAAPAPEAAPKNVVAGVIRTGEATFSSDGRAGLGPRSVACVPLRVRHDVLGAVYLDSNRVAGLFTPADRDMLAAFAHQAALAIENARMFEGARAMQDFQTRILEAIANGVVTLSPRREITTFNRAAQTTFGIESDGVVGRDAQALARIIPEFPELLDTFFESGAVTLRAEVDAQRADRTPLTIEIRLSPLHSAEGTGAAMVVTDVTQHRRLEEAHEAELEKAGRIAESFSRYLAPHVVQSLMDDPGSIKLGGERQRATMLFADVRGFTALTAELPPERIVHMLNAYFEEAVGVVFEFDGLLDKFYGDGLMAVFGPPRVRADDARRAVLAAIRLHEHVAKLEASLAYPLRISVGLATGEVVAGHFGSAKRMDYTVIGDAVNLASGLQSAAPPGTIYCDEETISAAGTLALPVHRLATRIKGRAGLVNAYAILSETPATLRT